MLVLLPPLFLCGNELLFCNFAVAILVRSREVGFGSGTKLFRRNHSITVGVNFSEALRPARLHLGLGDNTVFVGVKPIEPTFCFVSTGKCRRRAQKEQRGGEDKAALHFISP